MIKVVRVTLLQDLPRHLQDYLEFKYQYKHDDSVFNLMGELLSNEDSITKSYAEKKAGALKEIKY